MGRVASSKRLAFGSPPGPILPAAIFGDGGIRWGRFRRSPDLIYGGDGKDRIYGEASPDDLNGDKGDDFLDGGLHNDSLRGGDGKDTCTSGEVRMSSCEP